MEVHFYSRLWISGKGMSGEQVLSWRQIGGSTEFDEKRGGQMQSVEAVDLSGLNPKQRDAVTLVGKSAVVFAGPGSGKTTVLTRRAAWLLSRGVPANRIMVVTFTRAAAQEMRRRLLKQTGSSTGMTIGTFHSVFLRLLRNAGVAIPRLAGEREQTGLIRELLIKSGRPADEETVSNTLSQIGYCKGNLILPERMKLKQAKNIAFRELFQAYQQGWSNGAFGITTISCFGSTMGYARNICCKGDLFTYWWMNFRISTGFRWKRSVFCFRRRGRSSL